MTLARFFDSWSLEMGSTSPGGALLGRDSVTSFWWEGRFPPPWNQNCSSRCLALTCQVLRADGLRSSAESLCPGCSKAWRAELGEPWPPVSCRAHLWLASATRVEPAATCGPAHATASWTDQDQQVGQTRTINLRPRAVGPGLQLFQRPGHGERVGPGRWQLTSSWPCPHLSSW